MPVSVARRSTVLALRIVHRVAAYLCLAFVNARDRRNAAWVRSVRFMAPFHLVSTAATEQKIVCDPLRVTVSVG